SIINEPQFAVVAIFFLALVILLCAGLSVESREAWQSVLFEPLFTVLDILLVLHFNQTIYLLYVIEGLLLIGAAMALKEFWIETRRRSSSRELRGLQSITIGTIIVCFAILTHWLWTLFEPANVGTALIGVAILYVATVACIDWAYAFAEP